MARYLQYCRFCGKPFYTVSKRKDVCNAVSCQYSFRKQEKQKAKEKKKTGLSINDVVRRAEELSKETGRLVTYGQVSLFLEHGIKMW